MRQFKSFPYILMIFMVLPGCSGDPDDLPPFPDKTDLSYVFDDNGNETSRQVSYWPNGATVRSVHIDYKNGVTSNLYYRREGTLAFIEEFYPFDEALEKRIHKSIVDIGQDGESFINHSAYRPDGTLSRRGKRLEDGSYETFHFDESGRNYEKRIVHDDSKVFLEEEEYYTESGITARKLKRVSSSTYQIELFSEDGAKVAVINDRKFVFRDGEFFYPDGRVKAVLKGHRLGYDVEHYSQDGFQIHWVEFIEESVLVIVFGPSEIELFKQYWKRTDGESKSWCEGGSHYLFKVEVLNWDGSEVERTQLDITENRISRWTEYDDRKDVLSEREFKTDDPFLPAEIHAIAVSELVSQPDFECLSVPQKMKW